MTTPIDQAFKDGLMKYAEVFDLSGNGSEQPAFPHLGDLSRFDPRALVQLSSAMPRFLMVYTETGQVDNAKALVAEMRRIAMYFDELIAEANANDDCECGECVARRAGEKGAVETIAKAKGVSPKSINPDGEVLH